MGQRTSALADRIQRFSDDVVTFVQGISDADWGKICEWEEWPVGATARHIGQHMAIHELAAVIVDGKALPDWTRVLGPNRHYTVSE